MSDNKPNLPQKPVTPTLHKKPIPLTPLQKKECGKIKRKGDTSAVVSPSVLKGHSRMYVISRTTSLFYPSLYEGRFTRKQYWIYGILGGIVFNIIYFALLHASLDFAIRGNDESAEKCFLLRTFVEIIFSIFYALPVCVKRIHDLGYSAIFLIILMFILSFITIVGAAVGVELQEPALLVLTVVGMILGVLGLCIWLAFFDSQEGANRYGDSEKYPDLLIRIREAIRKEDTEKVKQLLKNGAATDIKNKKDKEGMTPLYVAVQGGNTEIVKLLIEAGADVNKADDPFYWALGNGHTEIVKLLIEAGADVNKANKYGNTPLTAAARCGHTEIVKLLIEAGADVNANNGMTPLQVASNNGHTGIVELLKQAGARE